MSTILGRLTALITADPRGFLAAMGSVEARVTKTSGLMQKAAVGMGTGLAVIGVASAKLAIDFDRNMSQVDTLIAGQIERQKELRAEVLRMSREFGTAADDLAGGTYQVISAFGDAADTSKKLEIAVKAAAAGAATTTDSVNLLSAVTKGYGDTSAAALQEVADLSFQAVKDGQCVVGSTRVLQADGSYRRIDELQDGATIIAFDGRTFVPMPATWVDQGVKPTVRLRTRLGREIVTTKNHPYLTKVKEQNHRSTKEPEWIKVSELRVGDRIAVPTALPFFGRKAVEEEEAAFLGLWLAEGSGVATSPRVASTRYGETLAGWVEMWGCSVKNIEKREGRCPVWEITADAKGVKDGNKAQAILRRHGLLETTSGEKHIPDEVFTWNRKSVATLLRWLFNGDGWLADKRLNGSSGFQLGFVSKSERLVRDVAHLLLRFGIVGTVRQRENKWCWETQRFEEVKRFLAMVGIDRPTVAEVEEHEPECTRRSHGVVEFDPIVSIIEEEKEHVFDLCVEELHNFVANDIVAHNTTYPELAASIGRVVPTFVKLRGASKESKQELFALFSTLTGVTGNASEVATQISGLARSFIKPTEAMSKAIKQLGYDSGEALVGDKGLVGAFKALIGTTDGSTAAVGKLFQRAEALTALFALAEGQADTFDQKLNNMADSAGRSSEAFGEVEKSVGFKLTKALRKLEDAFIDAGSEMLPLVDSIADELIPAMESALPLLQGIVRSLAWIIDNAGKVAGGIETLAEEFAAHNFGGQTKADQAAAFADIDQRQMEWMKRMRERYKLTGDWLDQVKDEKKALEILSNYTNILTKAETARLKKIAGIKEETKELTKTKEKDVTVTKRSVETQSDLVSVVDELAESSGKLEAQVKLDGKALGDMNKAVELHADEILEMAKRHMELGLKLDAEVERWVKLIVLYRDVKKHMEEINRTVWENDLKEWGDEAEEGIRKLPVAIEDTSDAVRDSLVDFDAFDKSLDRALDTERTERWISGIHNLGSAFQNYFGDKGSVLGGSLMTFSQLWLDTWESMDENTRTFLGGLSKLWSEHWDQILSMGLNTMGQLFGGRGGSALSGAGGGIAAGASIGSIFGPGGMVPGAIIGGLLGGIGGWFGGGESAEEKRQRELEAQQRYQEETNRLLEEFITKLQKLTKAESGAIEWTTDLQELFARLRGRGVDFSDALGVIDNAILATTDEIEAATARMEELPGRITGILFRIDDLRQQRFDARSARGKAQSAFTSYAFDEGGISPERFTNLMTRLRKFQGQESKLGGYISFQEQRQLLRGVDDPQTKVLLQQLVQAENAVFQAEAAVKEQQEIRKDTRKELVTLQHNLPLLRERILDLKDVLQKLKEQAHGDARDIIDELKKPMPRFATGGLSPGSPARVVVDPNEAIVPIPQMEAGVASVFKAGVRRGQSGTGSGGGGVVNNYYIDALDVQSFLDLQRRNALEIRRINQQSEQSRRLRP